MGNPKYLYHYTSQTGLLGIIKTGKLWMTDILYLNDSSEFLHTIELIKSEITERRLSLPPRKGMLTSELTKEDIINNKINDVFDRIEESLNSNLKYFNGLTGYVFSFSKKRDDINQWRGYCPKEGGFCIGFDTKKLESKIKNKSGYKIDKCTYGSNENDNKVKRLFDKIYEIFSSDENIESILMIYLIGMILMSSFIKRESFSTEFEYRIFHHGRTEIKHREGKSMLIPYIEGNILDKDGKLPISKIIVGPTPHPEISMMSVDSLLKSEGYKGVDVTKSKIPYRSW